MELQSSILLGVLLPRRERLDVLVKEELAVEGNVAVALKLREILDEQLGVAHQVAPLRAVILWKSAWRTRALKPQQRGRVEDGSILPREDGLLAADALGVEVLEHARPGDVELGRHAWHCRGLLG